MTELSVGVSLQARPDQRSLREARREIEDTLGDVTVDVATSGGGGGGAGASMLREVSDDTTALVGLAEDRNDLLEDILDILEDESGGADGGLLRGTGDSGGGGGGGIGGLPIGILTALGLGAAGAGAGAAASSSSSSSAGPRGGNGRGRPGGVPDPSELPDIGPTEVLAGAGAGAASAKAAQAARGAASASRGAAGAATGGAFGVAANELQFLEEALGIAQRNQDTIGGSGGGSKRATTPRTPTVETQDSQPEASRPQSVNVNPTINIDLGGQGQTIQRAVEQAFTDIETQVAREIEQSVIGDIEDSVTSAAGNLGL